MELVIAIAILALLVGVTVPMVGGVLEDARISRAKADIDSIAKAILSLYKDTSFWPTDTNISSISDWNNARNGLLGNSTSAPNRYPNWKGAYISNRIENDPWGIPYIYQGNGRIRRPVSIRSAGPDRTRNNADDIIYNF
jgi:general secretion pathway protein G